MSFRTKLSDLPDETLEQRVKSELVGSRKLRTLYWSLLAVATISSVLTGLFWDRLGPIFNKLLAMHCLLFFMASARVEGKYKSLKLFREYINRLQRQQVHQLALPKKGDDHIPK